MPLCNHLLAASRKQARMSERFIRVTCCCPRCWKPSSALWSHGSCEPVHPVVRVFIRAVLDAGEAVMNLTRDSTALNGQG